MVTDLSDKEESDVDVALNLQAESQRGQIMSDDVSDYSSHDWRKHTHDAVVVDDKGDKNI